MQKKTIMKRLKTLLYISAVVLLAACGEMFSYHPYDARFSGARDINAGNKALIESRFRDKDTLRFAFITDSHQWYGETKAMVADVNSRKDIDFVIHGGDLTDCATTDEFVWMRDILQELNAPYVAMIGNHDLLGTGLEVFEAMYGDVDFSFIAGGVKFICINTNATEYNYMAAVPNFDFLISEAARDTALYDRTVLCMHARPYSDQFNNNVALLFSFFCRTAYPSLMFCINGHGHYTATTDVFGDGVLYYEVGCAQDRTYSIFTITPEGYSHETVYF